MKIAVVGSGYVGLVAGACLAENGNEVMCVDKDPAKIRSLQRGKIPIYEPGLEELVRRNRSEKRLVFTTALERGVRSSQIIFIAVGTPTGEDGSADLQHVLGVARDTARAMNGYKVIVNKSTVPVGTAAKVREVIRRETTHPFSVVSNPEFLKQGAAIDDFMKPDRVVIGAEDPRGAELMKELYAPFTRTGAPIMLMDCASAELSKYAANAMLATRISFMNEVANVCEATGANVDEVRRAVAADRRIGSSFLFPGVGYGGSCFPKDVKAMVRFAAEKDYKFSDPRSRRGRQRTSKAAIAREDAVAPRHVEGQAHCHMGPRVQAAHRRHAGSPVSAAHSGDPCCRRVACRPTIPRRWGWHAGSSGRKSRSLTTATLRSKGRTRSRSSPNGMSSASPISIG